MVDIKYSNGKIDEIREYPLKVELIQIKRIVR